MRKRRWTRQHEPRTRTDERRRRILAYLDECDGDVATFSDLLDAVVEGTSAKGGTVDGASADGASTDHRERAATRLHHAHLPKLAESGLVEFDERARSSGTGADRWSRTGSN